MVGDGIEVFVGHNQVPIDRLVIDVSTWIEPGRLEELLRAAVGVDQLFAGGSAVRGHRLGGLLRTGIFRRIRVACGRPATGGEAEDQCGSEQETCCAFPEVFH